MRKYILILFISLISGYGFSQISINSDEIIGAGDVIFQANDTDPAPSITPGDAGENITWDFSDLAADYVDTIECILPQDTPFWDEFPDANLAMNISDSGYLYVVKNAVKMAWIGMMIDIEGSAVMDPMVNRVAMHIIPEDIIALFPIDFGNTMEDSYSMVYQIPSPDDPDIDSVRFKSTKFESEEIDAWGQMILPLGTYNVLRSHVTTIQYDSVWIKTAIGWTFAFASSDESETYKWWSDDPGTGFVIATLNTNSSRAVTSATYVNNEIVQNTPENNLTDANFNLFPNPVKDQLNISLSKSFNGQIAVMDLTGQTVINKSINRDLAIIRMDNLPSGLYIYELISDNGQQIKTGKIVKR